MFRAIALFVLFFVFLFGAACDRSGKMLGKEYAYVSAPQVNLRDRLSAVYNKVGVVPNGTRVEILEKSRRFYRVKADGVGEGWVEMRYLVDQETFDGFEKLAKDNANAPAVSRGLTRAELNMHLTPARDGDHLYQLKEAEKIEVLQRAVTDKNAKAIQSYQQQVEKLKAKAAAAEAKANVPAANGASKVTEAAKPATAKPVSAAGSAPKAIALPDPPPPILEDWWLVRDSKNHAGWVLARMVDVDIPLEIAQYAEGKRIVASFILNTVQDVNPDTGQTRAMPQYLVLTTEPKDGQPFDYNHIRVFSWNRARHRYETAYRERDLFGVFPASVGHAVFDKEGDLPTFTLHVKDDKGQTIEKKYKMNGPIVRRILSPEEEAAQKQALEQKLAQRKAEREARIAKYRATHPTKAKVRRTRR